MRTGVEVSLLTSHAAWYDFIDLEKVVCQGDGSNALRITEEVSRIYLDFDPYLSPRILRHQGSVYDIRKCCTVRSGAFLG